MIGVRCKLIKWQVVNLYLTPIILYMRLFALMLLLLSHVAIAGDEPIINIHTAMMESTVKIVGNGSVGTGFIVGRPSATNPQQFFYTLVTANHVLAGVQGDAIILVLRRLNATGDWERIELSLQIRNGGKDLWKKHPDVDLAALFVRLPKHVVRTVIPLSLMLSDKEIAEFEIGPGTELLCLGYPFGAESNPEGFPVLRSGKIASYPLLPTKKTKTFLFDFTVFRGNSGGPVYIYDKAPIYGGAMHVGATAGIMGLVTAERNITQKIEQLYEKRETITPLVLGEVIHASFIVDLVNSLPEPSK